MRARFGSGWVFLTLGLAVLVCIFDHAQASQLSTSETIQFARGFSAYPNFDEQLFADSGTIGHAVHREADFYLHPAPNPTIVGIGEVNARASYGSLGAHASGQYFGAGAVGETPTVEATTSARFFDTLTIPGSGQGFIAYTFRLSGSLIINTAGEYGPPAHPTADVSLSVTMGSVNESVGGSDGIGFHADDYVGGGPSLIAVDSQSFATRLLPFNFGESFNLNVSLSAAVSFDQMSQFTLDDLAPFLNPQYNDVALANFLDTAQLSGIQVFDSNGDPVSDFTIQADSGTQYPLGVPEPHTMTLLALGLLGLAAVGAARRRR